MPSSSTRNTYFESEVFKLFRQTYTRLYYAYVEQPNDVITRHYATLLDIPSSDLVSNYLKPRYDCTFQTNYEYADDLKSWNEFVSKVKCTKRDVNIVGAAECLHWVGLALEVVGRYEEAMEWRRLRDELRSHFGV